MSYTEFYKNGYGVSIISSEFSYGLELAVLRGNAENAEIRNHQPGHGIGSMIPYTKGSMSPRLANDSLYELEI